jgi:hypothetical protein
MRFGPKSSARSGLSNWNLIPRSSENGILIIYVILPNRLLSKEGFLEA